MSVEEEKHRIPDPVALLGYQMAIQNATEQGAVAWQTSNVMMVANSVVLAGASALRASASSHPVFGAGLAIVGTLLCLAWLALNERNFSYLDYFTACARQLEVDHLAPTVRTIALGEQFSTGRGVCISDRPYGISWPGRIRSFHVSRLVILLFAIVHMLVWPGTALLHLVTTAL